MHRSSLLVFFKIWFSNDIGKVVAMMTLWNKVFTTFPYLDDIRFGIDKGLIRVGSVRFGGFIEIFVVDVSIRRCNCLSFVVAISTSSFDLFSDKIRFLQPSVLVVKDCKHVLLRLFHQPMFFRGSFSGC